MTIERIVWAGTLALAVAGCGSDERTLETIPIPAVVDACLDELQAPGQPLSLFGTTADSVQLCVVLQGLDCILSEPLCAGDIDCPAPRWSCPDPGLELDDGAVLDTRLFIVTAEDPSLACADVTLGDPPQCTGARCLARIDYQLVYGDGGLSVGGAEVQITHSGYLSETVGSFDTGPASICSAIPTLNCEGPGCDAPIRIDLNLAGIGSGRVDVDSEARAFTCEDPRCTLLLPSGRSATLTASAAAGSVFGDWGDACSSNQRSLICALQPSGETLVTARFGYRLDVEVLGQGSVGSVDGGLDGTGINCVAEDPTGQTCTEDYVTERRVVLTAEGSPDWPFSRWEGCDASDGTMCEVTMSQARFVRATFGRQVSVEVEGGGTVTVNPGGRVCADRCAFAFTPGQPVTLEASAGVGATRYDWGGDCAAASGAVCDLGPLDRNVSATARFGYDVTTSFDAAQGGVSRTESAPPVACASGGGGCRSYLPGTRVVFTAEPSARPVHAFIGWQGLCAGAMSDPVCDLTIGGPGDVGASFERAVLLAVSASNDGPSSGTVQRTPEPNASVCAVDCSDRYLASTGSVMLTARTPAGTRFLGWARQGGGQACEGDDGNLTCEVDVSDGEDRALEARFIAERVVTVSFVGEGTGTVSPIADPASPNWSCAGSRCAGAFEYRQRVVLQPQTASGNHLERFISAEPDCGGTRCEVTIGAVDVAVTAEFEEERVLDLTLTGNTGGSVLLPRSFNEAAPLRCTTSCSRTYLSGETFTLVAEAPTNVVFNGWQGCNLNPTATSCEVTLDADPKALTATFLPPRELSFELLGSGSGRVDISGGGSSSVCSGPAPFTCPVSTFPSGTSVTLTVPAVPGTDFVDWGGDCSSAPGTVCTLQMTGNRSASATFAQRTYNVTVNFGGAAAASGVVAWISPPRADCSGPSPCTQIVNEGTAVQLRPIGGPGYQFDSWSGCDQVVNGNECRLNAVTADRSVTANFIPLNGVQVVLAGSGTGRIIWNNPSRPTCERSVPATCPVEQVTQGTTVRLSAQPANADTEFVRWTGCTGGSNDNCNISSVGSAVSVTAEFVALHDITINLAGDGNGRVEWNAPSFPDCVPGTCPPRQVQQGTTVTLTAQAVTGATFTGWSGCDSVGGTNNTVCTLSAVTQDRSPSASYFDDRTITVRMRGVGSAGMSFLVGGPIAESCAESPVPYDCTKTFAYTAGTVVLAPVITSTVTTFDGWSMGCMGTGSCLVDVQTALTHVREATFD